MLTRTPIKDKLLKMNAVITTPPLASGPMHALANGNSPGGQTVTLGVVGIGPLVVEELSVLVSNV